VRERARPRRAARPVAGEGALLPLGPLRVREGRRAGALRGRADGGEEIEGRPEGWGHERIREFTARDYHQVSDEIELDWDLSGAAQDMELLHAVGLRVATDERWPEWKTGSEFKARRDAMLARRP
jgi:hypothetical protein